jgi:hypothetical protein
LVGKLLDKCPLGRPSGQLPRGRWNWLGICPWWTFGTLSVEPANIMLLLLYCVVLAAVDCLKVHRCMQTVRCAVWHRVFFWSSSTLHWCIVCGIQLSLCTQPGCQFAIGHKMADRLRKEELPPRICHLRPSLVPSSFSPHVSGFSQEVEWTEDP